MMPSIRLVSSPALRQHELRIHCSSCRLRELCLPMGLGESEMQRFDQIVSRRRFIPRDGILYRMNDPFTSLYAIGLGHFKTYEINAGGEQQITGFQMGGELLGLNAISTGRHHCNAMALEDSEICEIPFSRLEELFSDMPALLHQFLRMMSHEISQEEDAMLLLGNMRAEQRLAAFLVNLASRYGSRGYSSRRFQLRMTREDIGNYLGLTIESISRLLSKFKQQDWLRVRSRELELVDLASLDALATGVEPIQHNGIKFAPWN
jgi:CRP/FNR family transcriptional regulator